MLAIVLLALVQGPLPVDRDATLKAQDAVYTIEGRVLLESRVDLESQRAIVLRGLGENATLVVAGSFTAKAALGGDNTFENLTIEVAPECRELYLANVTWRGGGIRTAPEAPTAAKIYCEYLNLGGGAGIELAMSAGSFDLQVSSSSEPIAIRGTVGEGKKRNLTKVELLTCKDGLGGGVQLADLADVTVRNNSLGGPALRLERIAKLDFDGNLVRAESMELVAAHYEAFGQTEVHNCDFAAGRVRVFAPAEGEKRLKLAFDRCWFRGLTEPAPIRREIVRDATQDPECGIFVDFTRTSDQPLGLGGKTR